MILSLLRDKVNESGLKKQVIAEKIGKSPQHLSMMLSGKAKMSKDIENSIIRILNGVNKVK